MLLQLEKMLDFQKFNVYYLNIGTANYIKKIFPHIEVIICEEYITN